jgi:hypothetical protein
LMPKGKQALVNIGDLTKMSNKLAASSRPNAYIPPPRDSEQTIDDIPSSAEGLQREQENPDLPKREIGTSSSEQETKITTVTESQAIADFIEAYDKKGTYENGKLIKVGDAVEAMRKSMKTYKSPSIKDPEFRTTKVAIKPRNKSKIF